LKEIEKNIKNHNITKEHKNEILDYLNKLLNYVASIKKQEYEYEGDMNININEYLIKIKSLIEQINTIK
jgi:hypothetical protein